jgi:hypothetical protein
VKAYRRAHRCNASERAEKYLAHKGTVASTESEDPGNQD